MSGKLIFKNLVEISLWPCESFDLSNIIIFFNFKSCCGFLLNFCVC